MGDRRKAWLTVGATVTLLCTALGSITHAQGIAPVRADVAAADGQADPYASQVTGPPVLVDDSGDTTDTADASANQDGAEPVPRIGQRPVVLDGDVGPDESLPALRDGIIEVGEPLPVEDGVDPETVDTRPPEDIAIFENPPAGYDPLLFQIEDIDPIRDNRTTTRLFRLEPYDPIGIRIGSFVLFPEVELGSSYYSNVFRAPDAGSDTAFDVKPSARLVSNWSRHALELRGTIGRSYFNDYDTENDESYLAEARGRVDVTRRTNVQALVSYEQAPESRSALDASTTGPRAIVTTERAEAALNQRFNRLSLQLRGSVAEFDYSGIAGVGDRNYRQTEEVVRGTWEFKPTFSVFTEAAVNQRDYDTVASSDLISRSSDGQRYRVGVSFGNTGQILRGEASLGYGVQTPDDRRLHDVDGLIFDANATWRVSELTSVLLTARSDVSETTTANVGGAFARQAGVELRHSLRRYLVASAGLTYTTQDSQDGIIDENELRSMVGLEYYVSPDAVLFGRYAHARFDAVGSASDYDSDEVHIGVRIRR